MADRLPRLRSTLEHPFAAASTLIVGATVALGWSALSFASYQRVMSAPWLPGYQVGLRSVVEEGAMTLFFASVGLELSREAHARQRGHLRGSLPAVSGAVGGMLATAGLSLLLGLLLHSPALHRGWGVPIATDIAFTLGVLALAGPGVPNALRLFLLTLAVTDDVLSVVILSLTGVTHVRVVGLVLAAVVAAGAVRWGRRLPPAPTLVVLLVATWGSFAYARVDPALSGVVAGLLIRVASPASRRLERRVLRSSIGLVLPLFALVACGVSWTTLRPTGAGATIIAATVAIRLAGKTLGIAAGVAVAGACGLRRHPSITRPLVVGAGLLCAIGVTVPLLFAGALYPPSSTTYGAFTVGLLLASLLGAGAGLTVVRRATRTRGDA